MNPFLSKRLLINIAVVVVAVGANAVVAYTQIRGQCQADARTMHATAIRQTLDAWRATLDEGTAALGRFASTGALEPAARASERTRTFTGLEATLRDAFAADPDATARLDRVSTETLQFELDLQSALARGADAEHREAAQTDPAPSPAAQLATARAVAAAAYVRIDLATAHINHDIAALRQWEDAQLKAVVDQSTLAARRGVLMLILTMLGGTTLLIYTFGVRESAAREKLRIARSLWSSDGRFRALFDAHPVPMYIFDRETLHFLAVNAAATEQYGYTEAEFLGMTLGAIRSGDEFSRLETYLQRSVSAGHQSSTMAGIWQHRRKDGSQVSVDISYHALSFMGRDAIFVLADDVTDQINAEAEAQRSKQMLETVIHNIPQRIFWKDRESRYLGCNAAFARDAGLAYPEQLIGKTDFELPWRAYADTLRADDHEVATSGVPKLHYETSLTIDGGPVTVITNKLPLTDSDGRVMGVLGAYTDVTERRRADLALRLQSRALDASVNAILITAPSDNGNLIEYVNPAFKRITGYDPSEVMGQDCRVLQRDDRDQEGLAAIRQGLAMNREVSAVLRNYRKDGALFWNQLYIAPVPDADGQTTHHIGVINDVTELIRYQEQLEYQANYDGLTRLPNRNLLRDRLQQALVTATRRERGVAVVFIDLDGFKNVNDSLGHSIGDRLLSVVAERLARCARASDTVARHGGDEFVVVVTDTVDEQSLIAWMERVRAAISEPVWLDGTELYVGCSMGASLFPQDGEDVETLMKKADLAMYRAKDMGRNTFQFYQPEMNASAGARLSLERRLRRALRDNEFLLHYQPQVDLSTGRIVGLEALVRWRDPEVGLVPPSSFIPVAEESGLIGPLSEWVLREACAQNKAWQDAGLPPARVSVNLSARQFEQHDISRLVTEVLEETGLEPRYLELELTESAIMRNAEGAVSMLNELHALGIGLAIDDFGTGYSSLSYLKRFPVDRLKIDRSFVSDIGESDDDETITSAIIALAHSLELEVIAEGVETLEQLEFLRARACDGMQGFYFSKPVPRDAVSVLLQQYRSTPALEAV